MYICKVLKTDVSDGKERNVFEKISQSGESLLKLAKTFAKKHYNKKEKKPNTGYEMRLTPFVELNGFKNDARSVFPEHNFYHGSSTVFNCYGKPIWIVTIIIYKIDVIK